MDYELLKIDIYDDIKGKIISYCDIVDRKDFSALSKEIFIKSRKPKLEYTLFGYTISLNSFSSKYGLLKKITSLFSLSHHFVTNFNLRFKGVKTSDKEISFEELESKENLIVEVKAKILDTQTAFFFSYFICGRYHYEFIYEGESWKVSKFRFEHGVAGPMLSFSNLFLAALVFTFAKLIL